MLDNFTLSFLEFFSRLPSIRVTLCSPPYVAQSGACDYGGPSVPLFTNIFNDKTDVLNGNFWCFKKKFFKNGTIVDYEKPMKVYILFCCLLCKLHQLPKSRAKNGVHF